MKALEKAEIDEEVEEEIEEQVAPPDKKEDGDSDNDFGSPSSKIMSPDNDNNNGELNMNIAQCHVNTHWGLSLSKIAIDHSNVMRIACQTVG